MPKEDQKIKCVVWDLDNTVWNGVLLEDSNVVLRNEMLEIIKQLDERGILQSIASKNNYDDAMNKLKSFGIDSYFLYPKINWGPKSESITLIAKNLNIGLDTFAFIDDQNYELDEVKFSVPDVLTMHVDRSQELLSLPEFMPRFITADSKKRRQMYQGDIQRNQLEESFKGSKEDFLRTLKMKMVVSCATEDDLQRAEELTQRTNQLNTTGYTYSYNELNNFRNSDKHQLLIIDLDDKYGSYGKIGLVLLEKNNSEWTIKLLLMSCRVMSRNVGSVLIHYLRQAAKAQGVKLKAEFIPTDRNRMMYMTYKFTNFIERERRGDLILLENILDSISAMPDYLDLIDHVYNLGEP